jgi:protein-S-isoprenylcysteine O-methyltransferase Ste14
MSLTGVSTAVLALALYAVYLGLVVGLRILIQIRRTGSTGVHGLGGRPGSVEWIAGVGFTVALLIGATAPLLALLGVVEPIARLDTNAIQTGGFGLALGGIGLTFYAQMAMGASWRVGVDRGERTALVTSGPFALVRNPIFAAVFPTALGLALLVPTWIAFVGLVVLVIALELQVRVVEEPYLLRAHPNEYAGYAARVGRFVPGVGRIRVEQSASARSGRAF